MKRCAFHWGRRGIRVGLVVSTGPARLFVLLLPSPPAPKMGFGCRTLPVSEF